MVEPADALKVAKQGTRAQILLWVSEAHGISHVRTMYQHGRVEVPLMSFVKGSAHCLASVANDFQRTEVRGQAKTSIYLRADAWKQTISANNLNNLPNADTCFNTGIINIIVDMAVANAGATGHLCYQELW